MTSYYVARSSLGLPIALQDAMGHGIFSFDVLFTRCSRRATGPRYVSANRFGPELELRAATLAELRLALEVTFPAVYDASPS